MEDTIDHIVSCLRHGAQGLEELNQVLYLLGPVGGGKSSLAERIKELMEQECEGDSELAWGVAQGELAFGGAGD